MSWSMRKIAVPSVEEPPQVGTELLALGRVEAGGRLVEQQQLRRRGQGPGHADELALAVRQVARQAVGARRRARARRAPGRRAAPSVRRSASGRRRSSRNEYHRGRSAATSRLSRTLRSSNSSSDWNVRDSPRWARRSADSSLSSMPSKLDRPARHGGEAGDGVDERRLAGAVRSDQPDELAGLDVEVDAVVGGQAAVADGQLAGLQERQSDRPPRRGIGRSAGSWRRVQRRLLAAPGPHDLHHDRADEQGQERPEQRHPDLAVACRPEPATRGSRATAPTSATGPSRLPTAAHSAPRARSSQRPKYCIIPWKNGAMPSGWMIAVSTRLAPPMIGV